MSGELFSEACCCGSVTNMKGGIHPDTVVSMSRDLVLNEPPADTHATAGYQTHTTALLIKEPIHIIGIEIGLISIQRGLSEADRIKTLQAPAVAATPFAVKDQATNVGVVPANLSLYTPTGFRPGDRDKGGFLAADTDDGGEDVNGRNYFWTGSVTGASPNCRSHEDLFGYFADGGVLAEYNVPNQHFGIRLIVRYVPRLQFPPAYHDPIKVMQHYWKCSRGETPFLEGFYAGNTLNIQSTYPDDPPDVSIKQTQQYGHMLADGTDVLTAVSDWD